MLQLTGDASKEARIVFSEIHKIYLAIESAQIL